MKDFQPVSKEDFDHFRRMHPDFEGNVHTVCEPPVYSLNDFSRADKWPESMVGKAVLNEKMVGHPAYKGEPNEYYLLKECVEDDQESDLSDASAGELLLELHTRASARVFALTGVELERAEQWKREHLEEGCEMDKPKSAIMERWVYTFEPNSIAVSVKVGCVCGAIENVSDVDSW